MYFIYNGTSSDKQDINFTAINCLLYLRALKSWILDTSVPSIRTTMPTEKENVIILKFETKVINLFTFPFQVIDKCRFRMCIVMSSLLGCPSIKFITSSTEDWNDIPERKADDTLRIDDERCFAKHQALPFSTLETVESDVNEGPKRLRNSRQITTISWKH